MRTKASRTPRKSKVQIEREIADVSSVRRVQSRSTRTKTFDDLAMNDYNGDPLPYNSLERESQVEDTLRAWAKNDPAAKRLIESFDFRDAITKYIAAYQDVHEAEYDND